MGHRLPVCGVYAEQTKDGVLVQHIHCRFVVLSISSDENPKQIDISYSVKLHAQKRSKMKRKKIPSRMPLSTLA